MKKIVFLALAALLFALPVSAHTFKDDGDITVLLHTNPNDDPVAGQPAALMFSVFDQTNRFNTSDCNCSVQISEQGHSLLVAPLQRVAAGATIFDYTMPFTFPREDVYSITVLGTPQTPDQFQSFLVQYDLRVDHSGPPPTPPNAQTMVNLIIAILVLAAITVLIFRDQITYNYEK